VLDVLAVGEAMAVLCPDPPGPVRHAASLALSVAGAEANVVTYLAGLGLRTAFAGRIGDDPFGALISDRLSAAGVRPLFEVDPDRPTGIYVKDPDGAHTRVHYYRAGSAASAMDAGLWSRMPPARLVHLSGITPALSATCAELVAAALHGGGPGGTGMVSFDVNHRPKLWSAVDAAAPLRDLAARADLVFVGLDEAETLWGCRTAEDVRDIIGDGGDLVVKDGAVGATAFTAAGTAFVPAVPVQVVEPVGAGDAFAAGYVYGQLTGADVAHRLVLGHHLAGRALSTAVDVGAPIGVADLPLAARS